MAEKSIPSRKRKKKSKFDKLPPQSDWRTTDEDELLKRQKRAGEEPMRVSRLDNCHPVFTNFSVSSSSGLNYEVEIRGFNPGQSACTCPDFQQNGLGTCKHVEATKLFLRRRVGRPIPKAAMASSPRVDIVLDREANTLRVERNRTRLPRSLQPRFSGKSGLLFEQFDPAETVANLKSGSKNPAIRISIEVKPWLDRLRAHAESIELRREYEAKVHAGVYPQHETTTPLYPYQREGMLHLAFNRRALLADEMGLGKTIQAIAACALLHRMGKARKALVVVPASLKGEWEEQIAKFTTLACRIIYGPPKKRQAEYGREDPPFFTIVNYEQVRPDSLSINEYLRPDIVILDEAQRIKNWASQTARAVKRLESAYAFVLTGTPIENRIDELYSIVDFLDPRVFGPLFRFNRLFYEFDDRGRPAGYKNLRDMHGCVAPLMLRRRKSQVEKELPDRTDRNFFVNLSDEQASAYRYHAEQIRKLRGMAQHRPLTREQSEKLMRELNMCRMICDTNYILDREEKACPKLKELMLVLDDCLGEDDVKVVVFSEWVRMLQLVEEALEKAGIGYAVHTGKVTQTRRRVEINLFKNDPRCRVLLASESGGAGLNLQVASVIINCDLPWNPAKLEQRVARVWRKHQTRPVTVVNLISRGTIEHGMLDTLDAKRELADGVLDLAADLDSIKFKAGGQNFLKRLDQVLAASSKGGKDEVGDLPPAAQRSEAFAQRCRELLGEAFVSCEERFPQEKAGSNLIVVVEREAERWQPRLEAIRESLFGPGKWDDLEPVSLQVIDQATAAALEQMEAAGLLQSTTRLRLRLADNGDISGKEKPLYSPKEEKRMGKLKEELSHKLRASRLLVENGFSDMARTHLEEICLLSAKWIAVKNHFPEPDRKSACLEPPLCRLLPQVLLEEVPESASESAVTKRLNELGQLDLKAI